MQPLEASLYHCRKGRKKRKKHLTAKTCRPMGKGLLHPEASRAAEPCLLPDRVGQRSSGRSQPFSSLLSILLSGHDFSRKVRLLQRPCRSSISRFEMSSALPSPPLHRVLCEMHRDCKILLRVEGVLPGRNTTATQEHCNRT